MALRAKEIKRDEELPIIKKSISFSELSITTPIKGVRCSNINRYMSEDKKTAKGHMINEVSKSIKSDTLDGLYGTEGFSENFCREVKKRFSSDCANFVFFNLKGDTLPNSDLTNHLGHVLYSASDKIICLPCVQKSVLLSPSPSGKSQKIDEKKIEKYLLFQKQIIDAVKVKNSKDILGVVPLLVPKYTRRIIELYFDKEIFNFVIDAGTANIMNKEPDLRSILDLISQQAKEHGRSLADTYIHAVNLGINHFSADEVSADDFLSLFAYIDTFGTTFKTRGKFNKNAKQRNKLFLPDRYTYRLVDRIPQGSLPVGVTPSSYPKMSQFNEKEQFHESLKVKEMVGEKELKEYIKEKAITEATYGKLHKIFSRVKIH